MNGNVGSKKIGNAKPENNNDAAFAKYLKKLDKYGEKEEDECK